MSTSRNITIIGSILVILLFLVLWKSSSPNPNSNNHTFNIDFENNNNSKKSKNSVDNNGAFVGFENPTSSSSSTTDQHHPPSLSSSSTDLETEEPYLQTNVEQDSIPTLVPAINNIPDGGAAATSSTTVIIASDNKNLKNNNLHHNNWIIVKRDQALKYWEYRYGGQNKWTCGVGDKPPSALMKVLSEELNEVVTEYMKQIKPYPFSPAPPRLKKKKKKKKKNQTDDDEDETDEYEFIPQIGFQKKKKKKQEEDEKNKKNKKKLSPQEERKEKLYAQNPFFETERLWHVNYALWNSSSYFLRCSPRHSIPLNNLYNFVHPTSTSAKELFFSGVEYNLGIRSLTTPSLGAACFREVMILDRTAKTLDQALSRRCFLRKRKDSSSNSKIPFLVGIGHSHTRYLAAMLCMSINLRWCSDFTSIQRLPFYPVSPAHIIQPDETNVDVTIHRAPMLLAYASSYYDQRRTLVRFLSYLSTKLTERGAFSSTKNKNKNSNNNNTAKNEDEDEIPLIPDHFESTSIGMKINFEKNNDDDDNVDSHGVDNNNNDNKILSNLLKLLNSDEPNNKIDEKIIKWAKDKILPSVTRIPTHFVISRGEWDMLYLNPDPLAMTFQIQRFIKILSKIFSENSNNKDNNNNFKIILQLPQVHVPIPASLSGSFHHSSNKKSHEKWKKEQIKSAWRNSCHNEERIQLMYDSLICAASLSTTSSSSQNENNLILFDSDRVTKSFFGYNFVDNTGHHYIDAALEVLALELRRIVERDEVANEYIEMSSKRILKEGKLSCKKVRKASKKFQEFETKQQNPYKRCSCHRDSPEDPSFCRSIKMLARDVG